MTEKITNVNAKVDDLEAAAKRYASKDTVISIGGYEFTPAKLMVAFTIVSSILGGLYGAFEVYKDYVGMKKRIAEYVAPDLTEFDKRLAVITQKAEQAQEYTNQIKNDLKGDIRRLENVVDNVERNTKQSQREMDATQRDLRNEMRGIQRDTDRSIKEVRKDIDEKIKKALDNPLANK